MITCHGVGIAPGRHFLCCANHGLDLIARHGVGSKSTAGIAPLHDPVQGVELIHSPSPSGLHRGRHPARAPYPADPVCSRQIAAQHAGCSPPRPIDPDTARRHMRITARLPRAEHRRDACVAALEQGHPMCKRVAKRTPFEAVRSVPARARRRIAQRRPDHRTAQGGQETARKIAAQAPEPTDTRHRRRHSSGSNAGRPTGSGRGIRSGLLPLAATLEAPSYAPRHPPIDASTTHPCPLVWARNNPASIPATRYNAPPPISPTSVGGVCGG